MAVIGTATLTYADWAKRVQDRKIAVIVEMLSQMNEILDDMMWREGNLTNGHKHTVRTGLPSGTWRLLNYGVQNAKSVTAQVTDSIGMLEVYSEVDKILADLDGNTKAFRLSEDRAFLEGLCQQVADSIVYGNTSVNPERFNGMAIRYNTTNTATAACAANVISAGGSGSDNSSIWLVCWGDQTCFGLFPKGSKAGLTVSDKGQQTAYDTTQTPPGKLEVYRTHYKWDIGFTVRDWRYVVRICNIDVSDLATMTSTGLGSAADLVRLLIVATNKPPSLAGTRPVFYMNRTVRQYLTLQTARTQAGIHVSLSEAQAGSQGKVITAFNGIPCKIIDKITNAEAQVT